MASVRERTCARHLSVNPGRVRPVASLDNGKNLPLWRDLSHFTYRLSPSAIRLPLLRYRSLAPRHSHQP
jgi:hypothetical protein